MNKQQRLEASAEIVAQVNNGGNVFALVSNSPLDLDTTQVVGQCARAATDGGQKELATAFDCLPLQEKAQWNCLCLEQVVAAHKSMNVVTMWLERCAENLAYDLPFVRDTVVKLLTQCARVGNTAVAQSLFDRFSQARFGPSTNALCEAYYAIESDAMVAHILKNKPSQHGLDLLLDKVSDCMKTHASRLNRKTFSALCAYLPKEHMQRLDTIVWQRVETWCTTLYHAPQYSQIPDYLLNQGIMMGQHNHWNKVFDLLEYHFSTKSKYHNGAAVLCAQLLERMSKNKTYLDNNIAVVHPRLTALVDRYNTNKIIESYDLRTTLEQLVALQPTIQKSALLAAAGHTHTSVSGPRGRKM